MGFIGLNISLKTIEFIKTKVHIGGYMLLKFSLLTSIMFIQSLVSAQNTTNNLSKELEDSLTQMVFPVVQDTLLLDEILIDIIDEETDLNEGKLKASGQFTTVPLKSNLGDPIYGALNIQTNLESVDAQNSFFSAQADLNLELKTLNVLKFVANVFGECEIIEDDNVNNFICIFVNGVGKANSVSDLAPVFNEIKSYAEVVYKDSDEIIASSLKSLEISTTEDGFVKAHLDLNLSIFNIDLEADVLITEGQISANAFGDATVTNAETESYKTAVLDYVKSLLEEESESSINLQSNLYLVFGFLEAFLYDYDEDME